MRTSVVATAPFIAQLADLTWCLQFQNQIEAHGGRLEVVWVRASADAMRRYIRYRGAARDAAKLADWDGYIADVDLDFTPVIEHRIIKNNSALQSLEEQAEQLLARIT